MARGIMRVLCPHRAGEMSVYSVFFCAVLHGAILQHCTAQYIVLGYSTQVQGTEVDLGNKFYGRIACGDWMGVTLGQ